jgi:aryl-phospho-beta-D-glucosidase BglC (GH1 family)
MKHLACLLVAVAFLAAAASPAISAEPEPPKLWWERGADTWYYKDDWKGQALSGSRSYTKTVAVPGGAASGWIYVWGDNGYALSVDGREVGKNIDGGLIDTYNPSLWLSDGAEKVALKIDGGTVCAEGELIAKDGKRHFFATDDTWQTADGKKPRVRKMAAGESSGAFHRAHNAQFEVFLPDGTPWRRTAALSDEEGAKVGIAKGLARLQKLNEQGLYLMRRLRPTYEILAYDPDVPWRRAERVALPLAEKARGILAGEAIPAQKAGRFADALAAGEKAANLISAAEAPVITATGLYQAEREVMHLLNVRDLLNVPEEQGPSLDEELWGAWSEARRGHLQGDWATLSKGLGRFWSIAADVRTRLEAAAAKSGKRLVGGLGRLDEFPEDRFGWINARELMGNDPANWPFIVAPSECPYIDIGGLWDFRLDPDNVGEKSGWQSDKASADGWKKIFTPMPWERQGYQEDNLKSPGDAPYKPGDARCFDKPYNGYAWYRKKVFVPAEWQGKRVMIQIGDATNWARVFINAKPLGEGRKAPVPAMEVPAETLQFGKENLIAIQVYNHDNFGGICSGRMAIYLDGSLPEFRETAMPLGYAKEHFFPTPGERTEHAILTSAMSPASVVASKGPTLELRGWEARGYGPPAVVRMVVVKNGSTHEVVDMPLAVPADVLTNREAPWGGESGSGTDISNPPPEPETYWESWVLLAGGDQDVLLVAPNAMSVAWKKTPLGGNSIIVRSRKGSGGPMAVLVMPRGVRLDVAACQSWARMLLDWPISASEVVLTDAEAGVLNGRLLRLRYNYCPLIQSLFHISPVAPMPMLASYGLQHKFPGLAIGKIKDTGYRSAYAPYLVAENTNAVTYRAPAIDRSKVLKGVGELFHGRTPEDWKRMADWGFDHCRYAWAFHADWDMPLVKYVGGPLIENNEATWKRLDAEVEKCNQAGLQMMLTWFSNEDQPQRDTGGAVRNSTRYWRAHPEAQKNAFELWRRLAERYKDKPEWAVAYDFFNEPAYMNADHWNRVMKELTTVVRSVDKKHWIVWEPGDGWAQPQWCQWMEPVKDDKVLYSFHHYGKHWGYAYDEYYPSYKATTERTQVDPWLEAILFSIRHHVPIHCGEFGLSMIQPDGDGEAWLNDYLAMFERFGIGWNWWNYSGRDVYRTGLCAGDRTSPYVPILTKWAKRSGAGASRQASPR